MDSAINYSPDPSHSQYASSEKKTLEFQPPSSTRRRSPRRSLRSRSRRFDFLSRSISSGFDGLLGSSPRIGLLKCLYMAAEDIMELHIWYNSSFKHIKSNSRVIYEGGRVKEMNVDVDRTCLKDVLDDLKVFRQTIEREILRLIYIVPQSNPAKYKFINTDAEYMEMLFLHRAEGQCELYLVNEYRGIPIRFFYNPHKLKRNLLQKDRDVVIPHFVLEDDMWHSLLYGDGEMEGATHADREESTQALPANQEEQSQTSPVQEEPILSTAFGLVEEHIEATQFSPAVEGVHSQSSAVQEPLKSTHVSSAVQEEHIQASSVHVVEMSTPGRTKIKVSHYCGTAIRTSPRLREKARKKEVGMSSKNAELNYVNIDVYEDAGEHVKSREYVARRFDIVVENEDIVEDELDVCLSQDSYNSLTSSVDDEFSEDDEESKSDNALGPICLEVGQTFEDRDNFRMALREHAILKNFEFKFVKNEGNRIVVKCAAVGCGWRLRAIQWRTDEKTFEIKTMNPTHSCAGINRGGSSQASAKWISKKIEEKIKSNRDITPKEISTILLSDYGIDNVPYTRIWRGREVARTIAFGSVDDNYKLVPTLAGELQKRNPGSHIEYSLSPDHAFSRMFISFRACIEGFKKGCRPFLGVDGCHLRSKYLGCLLGAVGLDGNNHLFVVAFAVVEGESYFSWKWFLQNLYSALGCEVDGLVIMSDMTRAAARIH